MVDSMGKFDGPGLIHTSLLSTFHWPEFSQMAVLNARKVVKCSIAVGRKGK